MDLTDLKFPDASFDAICTADAIEHVPQLEKALTEISRVLRPNGALIIQAPNLSTNILSFNYKKTIGNIVRKGWFLLGDLFSPRLRTIETTQLDVITGDKDAYNLLSPLWLKRWLNSHGFEVVRVTTYSLFFEPSPITGRVLKLFSKLPVLKWIGGRIVLVARKRGGSPQFPK